MFEGNEIEKELGKFGKVAVDVTPELKVILSVSAQIDIVSELQALAAKTATPIDDAAIGWVKMLLAASAPKA